MHTESTLHGNLSLFLKSIPGNIVEKQDCSKTTMEIMMKFYRTI